MKGREGGWSQKARRSPSRSARQPSLGQKVRGKEREDMYKLCHDPDCLGCSHGGDKQQPNPLREPRRKQTKEKARRLPKEGGRRESAIRYNQRIGLGTDFQGRRGRYEAQAGFGMSKIKAGQANANTGHRRPDYLTRSDQALESGGVSEGGERGGGRVGGEGRK